MTKKRLVIIGTGLSGYMLAKEWRKQDSESELTLISRDDGSFYSKPMLSNALAKSKTPEALVTRSAEHMASELNARILTHTTVQSINPADKTILTDKETVTYDELVLATGASPITPPLQGDTELVYQVNTLTDYASFRETLQSVESVLILGSGLIGCEFANDLLSIGKRVELVSMEATPLARLVPEELGLRMQAAFEAEGAVWHMNQTAEKVQKTATGVQLHTRDGNCYEADMLLCAIGLRPDLRLLDSLPLKTNRGICVDSHLQTSEAHIYALGDAIELDGRVELYITPLLLCARTLAHNLAHPDDLKSVHYPAMPVTVKTPLYSVISCPPLPNETGQWSIEHDDGTDIARFTDADNQLRGFALGNGTPQQRMKLTKEIVHD